MVTKTPDDIVIENNEITTEGETVNVSSQSESPKQEENEEIAALEDGAPTEDIATFDTSEIQETASLNDALPGVNFMRKLYGTDYTSDPTGARSYYYDFANESAGVGESQFYLSFYSTFDTSYFGFTGTSGDDVINRITDDPQFSDIPYILNGLEGNDNITGSNADNMLIGGADDDILNGNGGDDVFYYEGHNNGIDNINGGVGEDAILGSSGDDTIGVQTLNDSRSIEVIDGGDGIDTIRGGDTGTDNFDLRNIEVRNIEFYDLGDGGTDTFYGTSDADTILTGSGTKRIFGEDGDDTIVLKTSHTSGEANEYDGGAGFDQIITQDPTQNFTLRMRELRPEDSIESIDLGSGTNVIEGTSGGNRLDFSTTALNGVSLIDGLGGSDTIIGTSGNDVIRGGEGSDTMSGGDGDDIFLVEGIDPSTSARDDFDGGAGFDQIIGTAGDELVRVRFLNAADSIEVLDLGAGYDVLETRGSSNIDLSGMTVLGLDFINGGSSSDNITATQGDDFIQGNGGNDTLNGAGGVNTAVFNGVFTDYEITDNGDGTFTVLDLNTADGNDGRDTLININYAQFSNYTETLIAPNLPPVAVDDNITLDEDTEVTFNPTGNDTDPGDTITLVAIDTPVNGNLIDNGDGTFTYEPFNNFNGSESISYTIEDAAGQQATGTINFNVTPVNDAPDARNNGTTINEDETATIDVLGNDRDVDGDTLSIVSFDQPANGSVVLNPDGTFTYTPSGNYFGVDSFDYTITDGEFQDTATVNITINAANDAPDTVEDNITVEEDSFITFDVLANDSDVDGDTITLESFTLPTEGTLVQNPDGTFTYTPAPDFNGTDSFTYTVTDGTASRVENVNITVDPENDTPITLSDSATTQEDNSVVIDVLANDSDPDGDALSVTAFTQGANGTVAINPDGTVTYTPNADFNGNDSFTYIANDGNGGTVTETVTVQVNPENDAPVTVVDDISVNEDESVNIQVLLNDTDVDGDTLSIDSFTQPANGAVTLNPDGSFTYTPTANYNGADTFTYTVTDGQLTRTETVNITVDPVNDDPTVDTAINLNTDEDTDITVDVLALATDVDGDTLSISVNPDSVQGGSVQVVNGEVVYSPANNFNGADSFTYTITDGNGGSFTGTVNIDVTPINDAPNAIINNYETDEEAAITFDVLSNDNDIDGDAISLDSFTQPANGSLVQNPDGTLSYTPNDGFNGIDTFTYTITDPDGLTDTATVNITVNAVNDAPETQADNIVLDEDTSATFDVLANDSDPDGDALSIATFTNPANGSLTQNPDGTFTYNPNGNFNGSDSFTYTVTDGIETRTETVNITVNPINDAPVASNDDVVLDEDTSATFDVLANDSDIDGDALSVESFVQPANGSVVQNPDGTFSYTPAAGFNGSDSFTYTVTDGSLTHTATVNIVVNAINDAPVTQADNVVLDEDTAATFDVLANDSDPDGDALSVESFTQPANGSVVQNPDGTFTYNPAANYNGNDSFTYTVTDGNGASVTETVNIVVNPINDAPNTTLDDITLDEDTTATFDVLANDGDVDGDVLSVESFTQPANGVIAQNPDGTLTFTPNENFNGTDSFTYTVTDGIESRTETVNIVVNPVNDLSDADESITVSENDDFMVNVLDNTDNPDGPIDATVIGTGDIRVINNGNDITADFQLEPVSLGASAAYRITHTPTGNTGILSINAGGEFALDNETNNLFDFLGEGDNAEITLDYTLTDGIDTAASTATINVIGSLDAPITVADVVTLDEDTTATFDVLANDYDVDGDTISLESFTQPANGQVVQNPDGTFTFTPNADFNGNDSFTYTVTDGTSSVTETVSIIVNEVNDAPITAPDNVVLDEDTSATFDVLANDSDLDGDVLSVDSFTQPANGSVVQNPDGTFTYTPAADYNGNDTFTYTVSDGSSLVTETVNIVVNPINDAPIAGPDTITLDEDTVATFDVLANDSDVDGDALSVESFTQPANGTVVQNPDGTFSFTPNADFNGNDSFTYTVTDGAIAVTQTVDLIVNPVNDGPQTVEDGVVLDEDTSATFDVLANDSDPDGDALSVTAFTQGANGTVVQNPDGTFSYTPNADFNGSDTFIYTVSDGTEERMEVVNITVNPVNDAPVTQPDDVVLDEDTSATFDVLANDSDIDGDVLSVESFTQPANGVVVQNPDGTFTYTPAADYNGNDTFTYTVTDGTESVTETVNIVVNPVDDPVGDIVPLPTDEHTIDITFIDESAGFKNSFGYIFVDAEGTIHETGLVWENSSKVGSGGDLVQGQSVETITVPEGLYAEFFIIANGERVNQSYDNHIDLDTGTIAFVDENGEKANINDATDPILVYTDANGNEIDVRGHVFLTPENNLLNPDDIDHVKLTNGDDGAIRVGFEDLMQGGDKDFDDLILDIKVNGLENLDTGDLDPRFYNTASNGLPDAPAIDALPIPEHDVEIVFQGETAAYKNTFGYYTVDGSGNIHNVGIVFDNASRAGSGGNLVTGVSSETITIPEGQYVEFFIIANGFRENDSFDSIDLANGELNFLNAAGDAFANVNDGTPPQLVFTDANGNTSALDGNVYHSADSALNGDGINHVMLESQGINDTRLSFEDLRGGGDNDFNDVIVDINMSRIHIRGDADANTIDMRNMDFNFYNEFIYPAGAGDDIVMGSAVRDVLRGHAGNDQIFGLDGNDVLIGGQGADILDGGNGDDKLRYKADGVWSAMYGAKNVTTGDFVTLDGLTRTNDIFKGGAGEDRLLATSQSDALFLHGQYDVPMIEDVERFYMGKGDDLLDMSSDVYTYGDIFAAGGSGNDIIWSNAGNDELRAGSGDDWIHGGEGNDVIRLGHGADLAQGGEGDDKIYAQLGNDEVYGDAGNDLLYGGSGEDQIFGGEGNDQIYGQNDDDFISGGEGNDMLNGGRGNDVLEGDAGNDTLYGHNDEDTLFGGEGSDILYGGNGADLLVASVGFDRLHGGRGDDTFQLDDLNAAENTIVRFKAGEDSIDLSEIIDDLGVSESEFLDNLSLDYSARNTAELNYNDGTTEITFFHFEHIARNLEADDLDIITT